MNKTFKRLLSLAAASAMSLTLAATTATSFVYADESKSNTVTITDSNSNVITGSYTAYKLFDVTASQEKNTDGTDGTKHYTYSVISGAAINRAFLESTVYSTIGLTSSDITNTTTADEAATKVLDRLSDTTKSYKTSTDGSTATSFNNNEYDLQAFANAIAIYVTDSKHKNDNFTKSTIDATNNTLTFGYYLVLEETVDGNTDTRTAAMLDTSDAVDGNVTFKTKESTPTVEKKVQETNDSADSNKTTNWQDAADYDEGDSINYRLKGTLPSDYSSYGTYSYKFTDTLSAGLTYNNDAKVYVADHSIDVTSTIEDITDTTKYHDVTSWFVISPVSNYAGNNSNYTDGHVLTLTCDNLKSKDDNDTDVNLTSDSVFIVRYSAKLNDSAQMGSAGNPNKVTLTYTNNPYNAGDGDTTTTPEDEVTVYTYKIQPTKYADDTDHKMSGAIFELYKKGGVTRKDSSKTDFTQTDVNYSAGTGYTLVAKVTTASDGLITFNRIDAGDYILHEAYAPAGYKTVSDISFTVSATYDTDLDDTNNVAYGLNVTNLNGGALSVSDDKSTVTGNIIDTSSSKLPSTGGIGTTIFYVCGGSLVAIAAALLITKKRASAE